MTWRQVSGWRQAGGAASDGSLSLGGHSGAAGRIDSGPVFPMNPAPPRRARQGLWTHVLLVLARVGSGGVSPGKNAAPTTMKE
ncbi:MAG: hypothetical protein LBH48_07425 [Bifidobacteriaceae bacterium]|nr:hypothetical protein [Bifidobacteriaceae bacterium]